MSQRVSHEKNNYTIVKDTATLSAFISDDIRKENNISLEWDEDQNPIIMKYDLKRN